MKRITLTTPTTTSQLKKINRPIVDAVEKIVVDHLDKDGAQRVIKLLVALIGEKTLQDLSVSGKSKKKKVRPSHGYLSGYKPIKKFSLEKILIDLHRQADIISKLFGVKPSFDLEWTRKNWENIHKYAERLFLVLKWQSIAPVYAEAVEIVLSKLNEVYGGHFQSYCEGKLGGQYLRQQVLTASTFQKLGEEQNGYDIIVISAQFGLRHRGRSVHRVREVLLDNEFELSVFAVGIMLLTHHDRLKRYNDLWINCAGDGYTSSAGSEFLHALVFRFVGDKLRLGTSSVSGACNSCGSASGFFLKAETCSLRY